MLDGSPLSVIVVCYDMSAQIQNTIHTLVPPYQQQVVADQYDVVVVDNGSPKPLPEFIWKQADNVYYQHIPKADASVNPGTAINWAVANNRSPMLCIMIDGARMLMSPGVLRWGMDLASLSQQTIVEVRGWHLGPKVQMEKRSRRLQLAGGTRTAGQKSIGQAIPTGCSKSPRPRRA